MPTRKEQIYEILKLHAAASENGGVTTQYLAERLKIRRPNVSSLLNELVDEGRLTKSSSRPVLYRLKSVDEAAAERCFENLVGANGSLRQAIKVAKAAVIYPEKSLDTLIVGDPGTGKSFLAMLMYRYALAAGALPEDASFTVVDCKDYQDDEDRLVAELFGGEADPGLLETTSAGFLHIDNAHLVSTGLRNKICSSVEHNQHQPGEPHTHLSPTLILACSDAGQSACEDFAKKLPITIKLPSLVERPFDERLALIQSLFTLEATRAKHVFNINAELLRCLLLYETPLNIKQLKGDIKRACAIAYFRERESADESINIFMSDFEPYVRKGFLNYGRHRNEIERIIPSDYSYAFSETTMEMSAIDRAKVDSNNMYIEIDRRTNALVERGMSEEEIITLLTAERDSIFRNYLQPFSGKGLNKEELVKLVDPRAIELVESFLNAASAQLRETFPPSVFYALCLHVDSLAKGNTSRHAFSNHQMSELAQKHKEKYALSLQFVSKIEETFDITVPVEDPFLITTFLSFEDPTQQRLETPVMLLAFLGGGVAASLSGLINRLVRQNNTYPFEIPLDHQPAETYQALMELVMRVDQGKGIIALYDMPQVKNYFETIELETGIKIRAIQFPITRLGLEWARKAAVTDDIDVLYQSMLHSVEAIRPSINRVIVTLCSTGEGGAKELKHYIEQHGEVQDYEVIPLAMADRDHLRVNLQALQQRSIIHCIIGTRDPGLFGIPFIPISEILSADPAGLPQVLRFKNREKSRIDFDEVFSYLGEQLEHVNISKLRRHLPKVIEQINRDVEPMSLDTEIGLLMHIACNINRMLGKEPLLQNLRKDHILSTYETCYKQLLRILKPLERGFDVIFTDDEMANIIMIIKKI
jgi:transcriptional regulatory protein LevR/transcriptional regulator with AAA-type ATPase domain